MITLIFSWTCNDWGDDVILEKPDGWREVDDMAISFNALNRYKKIRGRVTLEHIMDFISSIAMGISCYGGYSALQIIIYHFKAMQG